MLYAVMQKSSESGSPYTFHSIARTNPTDRLLSKTFVDSFNNRENTTNSPYWRSAGQFKDYQSKYSTDFVLEFIYE